MPQKKAQAAKALSTAKPYVSPPISTEHMEIDFARADIVFEGVDHAGVSFEARVFLNNKGATERTPTRADAGYAGSFHIFGHGGCFGDVGHCDVRGLPRPYDPRPTHPLTPARKVVIATEALKKAMRRSKNLTVVVVPVVLSGTEKCDYENVVKLDRVSIVTYK